MQEKKPWHFRKVLVTGNKRTKEDILRHCLAPITNVHSWEEVAPTLAEVANEFKRLGVSVKLMLDDIPEAGPPESNACDLRVDVEDRCPISFGVKTTTNLALQPEMEGNLQINNLLGRAETISFHAHAGTDLSRAGQWAPRMRLSFSKPLLNSGPNKNLSWEAYQDAQWQQFSSLRESVIGTACSFSYDNHQITYELGWRDSVPFLTAPSRTRLLAGHSLKSSIKHQWVLDRRDNSILPTTGYAVEASHELAGLGGDVRFLKQQLSAQWHMPIPFVRDSVFSCTVKTGCLLPLFGDGSRAADRFFLGGATSLRGFQYNTAGPSQKGTALGGDVFASVSAHITMPLPLQDEDMFKLHAFVQAGSLGMYNREVGPAQNIKDFAETGRAAAGVGLVIASPLGRVEVNLCYPLRTKPGDCTEPWQLGVGMTFT